MPLANTFGANAARSYGFGNSRGKNFLARNTSSFALNYYYGIPLINNNILIYNGYQNVQEVNTDGTVINRYDTPTYAGQIVKQAPDGSIFVLYGDSSTQISIYKYDSNYTSVGYNTYSLANGSTFGSYDMVVDATSVYVCGVYYAAAGQRGFVARWTTASFGAVNNFQWFNVVTPATATHTLVLERATIDTTGAVIAAGSWNDTLITKPFVIKYTTAGAISWQRNYTSASLLPDFVQVGSILTDSANNVYFFGIYDYSDADVIKISSAGALVGDIYFYTNTPFMSAPTMAIEGSNLYCGFQWYNTGFNNVAFANISTSLSLGWMNTIGNTNATNGNYVNNIFTTSAAPNTLFATGSTVGGGGSTLYRIRKDGQIQPSSSPWSFTTLANTTSLNAFASATPAFTSAAPPAITAQGFNTGGSSWSVVTPTYPYTINYIGTYP